MREGGFFRMKVCVRIAGVSCLRRGTFPTREKYQKARQNQGFGGVYVAKNTLRGVKCRSPAFVGGARRETQRIPFVQKGRSLFGQMRGKGPAAGYCGAFAEDAWVSFRTASISPGKAGWRGSGRRCRAGAPRWSCPCSPGAWPARWPPRRPRRRRCPPAHPRNGRPACRRRRRRRS